MANPNSTGVWMDPLNKIVWHRAIKRRQKSVILEDGRIFHLDYNHKLGKPDEHASKGYVLITPEKGFVPRGWLNVETVEDKNKWLGNDS
jgi:hypothetical protein